MIIKRDGNQWFCASDGFTNLQEAKAGWGRTPVMALLDYLSEVSCQCDACLLYGPHDMDCEVHNEPAYPNGDCSCGLSTPNLSDYKLPGHDETIENLGKL